MDQPSEEEIQRVRAWDAHNKAEHDRRAAEARAEEKRERERVQAERVNRIKSYFEGKQVVEADFEVDEYNHAGSNEVRGITLTFDDGSSIEFDVDWEGTAVDLEFHAADGKSDWIVLPDHEKCEQRRESILDTRCALPRGHGGPHYFARGYRANPVCKEEGGALMGEFHLRDGFTFERVNDAGDVRLRIRSGFEGQEITREITVPENEWASVLASVSAPGETNETWNAARMFHGGEI